MLRGLRGRMADTWQHDMDHEHASESGFNALWYTVAPSNPPAEQVVQLHSFQGSFQALLQRGVVQQGWGHVTEVAAPSGAGLARMGASVGAAPAGEPLGVGVQPLGGPGVQQLIPQAACHQVRPLAEVEQRALAWQRDLASLTTCTCGPAVGMYSIGAYCPGLLAAGLCWPRACCSQLWRVSRPAVY